MTRFLLLASLLVVIAGCKAPGTITYAYQGGRWVPTTASFSRDDITKDEIRELESRLNGN